MKIHKQNYAQEKNERYNQKESHWVSLSDRVDNIINVLPSDEPMIKQSKRNQGALLTDALVIWDGLYPKLKWKDIKLVRAEKCKLSDIVIDDTMNRPLVWEHVLKIIKNFKQTKVMAINVYEDKNLKGKYVAWDGQHTAVVLYLLGVRHLGQLAEDMIVPIAIYDTDNKAEIRENFIVLNSEEGKEPLSPLAYFSNKIFGVRIDDSSNPNWVEANKKQLALTDAGIFLTETKFESSYAGACTQVKLIDSTSLDLVKHFCTYWKFRQSWPDHDTGGNSVKHVYVAGKEIHLVLQLLKLTKDQGITINDDYLERMVEIMYSTFKCNWNAERHTNPLFQKIDIAYRNWFKKKYHPNYDYPSNKDQREKLGVPTRLGMANGSSNTTKQDPYFIAFIIAQLKKSGFEYDLPKVKIELTDGFKPAVGDLF
jgi:hypothetical protein